MIYESLSRRDDILLKNFRVSIFKFLRPLMMGLMLFSMSHHVAFANESYQEQARKFLQSSPRFYLDVHRYLTPYSEGWEKNIAEENQLKEQFVSDMTTSYLLYLSQVFGLPSFTKNTAPVVASNFFADKRTQKLFQYQRSLYLASLFFEYAKTHPFTLGLNFFIYLFLFNFNLRNSNLPMFGIRGNANAKLEQWN